MKQSKNQIQALQLSAKNKYYQNIQMYLKVLADFLVHHTGQYEHHAKTNSM